MMSRYLGVLVCRWASASALQMEGQVLSGRRSWHVLSWPWWHSCHGWHGQCQDEFLHCTDPGLEQERINVTFHWTGNIVLLVLCGQEWCVVCQHVRRVHLLTVTRVAGVWRSLGILGAPWSLVSRRRYKLRLCTPSCVQDSGYEGVPIAGHALWAEVDGGIICVTLGEFTGLHKSAPYVFGEMVVIPIVWCRCYASLCGTAQSPWLLCMYGMLDEGALRRNCRQHLCDTSFFPIKVFLFSWNSSYRFWEQVWRGGSLMVPWFWWLRLIFLLLLSIG